MSEHGLIGLKLDRVSNGWILNADLLGPDTTPHTDGNAPTPAKLREVFEDDNSGGTGELRTRLFHLLDHQAGEPIP